MIGGTGFQCLPKPVQQQHRTCALLLLLLAAAAETRPSLAAGGSLPDARAVIGRVFKYRLAVSGEDGSQVQVTEANQDGLPSWLYYSPKSGSLKGVPGPADRGVYIIAVRGLSGSRVVGGGGDVFALSVVDDAGAVAEVAAPLRADDGTTTTTCRPRDPITVAGVVIDTDMASLSARQRVRLLADLATSVGVHERHVTIFPTSSAAAAASASRPRGGGIGSSSWLPDAADKSVLVAGPGNVAVASAAAQTGAAWVVGCGAVSDDHVLLLEDVEKSAADGRLARALGHGIVGWRVANRLPDVDAAGRHRLRRQAAGQTAISERIMSTGVPTPQSPPSAAFSGDLSRSAVVMTSATVTLATTSSAAPLPNIRPTAVASSPLPTAVVSQQPAAPTTVTTTTATTTTATTSAPTTTEATTTTTAATTTPTTTTTPTPTIPTTTTTVFTSPKTTTIASTAAAAVTVVATTRIQPSTTTAAAAIASSTTERPTTVATTTSAAAVLVVVTSPSSAERSELPIQQNATAARTTAKPPRASPTSPAGAVSAVTVVSVIATAKAIAPSTTAAARSSIPVATKAATPTTVAPSSSAAQASSSRPTKAPQTPLRPTPARSLSALKMYISIVAQPERLVRFRLPHDTFSEPLEDLRVALTLLSGKPLPHSHWVTFRPADNEILVLAARGGQQHATFLLGAANVANQSAQTKVAVHVQPPPPNGPDPAVGATQVYRLAVEADYDQLVGNVSAYESLVGALEKLHKGRRVVITDLARGSVVVSYVLLPDDGDDDGSRLMANESAQCDAGSAEMDNLQLFNRDGSMRKDVQQRMPYRILSLTSTPRAACRDVLQPMGGVQVAATTTHRHQASKSPSARFESLTLVAERGKELRYELPDDLFSDEEDGNTRQLRLQLRSVDSESSSHPTATEVSPSAPLQLHSGRSGGGTRRHVLQGLFWEQPSRSTAQRYQLVASNRHNNVAVVQLRLNVTEPAAPAVFALRAKLGNAEYSSFANNVTRQLELLSRIALKVYGDASTAHFSLLEVLPTGAKTLVLWTNTSVSSSLPAGACPVEAIAAVARVVMRNKTITPAAMDKKSGLGQWDPISIDLEARGACVKRLKPEKAEAPAVVSIELGKSAEQDAANFWYTVVVPVIVVIVLLVVAIVVAAVLINRRRRGSRSANVSGGGANGTFIGKTVPVIFDDEREDGAAACRTPLMHDDKPAGPPPPEYPNLYGGGGGGAYAEQKQPLMSSVSQRPDGSPGGTSGGGVDAMPPYQPPTPPVSEPDETSAFPRAASGGARGQQQNFVPP